MLRLTYGKEHFDPQLVGQGRFYLWRLMGAPGDPRWSDSSSSYDAADPDVASCSISRHHYGPCKYLGRDLRQWASFGILAEGGYAWHTELAMPSGETKVVASGPELAVGAFGLWDLTRVFELGVESGWQRSPDADGFFLRIFLHFGFTESIRSHVHTSSHKPCMPGRPENCPEEEVLRAAREGPDFAAARGVDRYRPGTTLGPKD